MPRATLLRWSTGAAVLFAIGPLLERRRIAEGDELAACGDSAGLLWKDIGDGVLLAMPVVEIPVDPDVGPLRPMLRGSSRRRRNTVTADVVPRFARAGAPAWRRPMPPDGQQAVESVEGADEEMMTGAR